MSEVVVSTESTDGADGAVSDIGTVSTVFFPGAGSFGGEVQPLLDAFTPEAWLVKYPGRFGRGFGIPAGSFGELVEVCVEQITKRLAEGAPVRPVLFGHSFGAYVAFATASRLKEVAGLVTVGAIGPGLLTVPARTIDTVQDAISYLESIDPHALAAAPSEEWREIVAETTVQDLRLLTEFKASAVSEEYGGLRGLHCPVVSVRGDTDPLTTDAGIREWERVTDGGFASRVFAGGHSDFLATEACRDWLREVLDGFADSR